MNLTPQWREVFEKYSVEAKHWLEVGRADAPDTEIFTWAKEKGYIVFTNDLDFGAILAATSAAAPSVLQVRTQALLPADIEKVVIAALEQFEPLLLSGALIVIDDSKTRARILPLRGEK